MAKAIYKIYNKNYSNTMFRITLLYKNMYFWKYLFSNNQTAYGDWKDANSAKSQKLLNKN